MAELMVPALLSVTLSSTRSAVVVSASVPVPPMAKVPGPLMALPVAQFDAPVSVIVAPVPMLKAPPVKLRFLRARLPLALSVPPDRLSAALVIDEALLKVSEPAEIDSASLPRKVRLLTVCVVEPKRIVSIVAPLSSAIWTSSRDVGSTLVDQLSASIQFSVPAPPSQQMPAHAPECVRRKTLPTIAPLIPGGRLRVVKLPLAVPPPVMMSKLCPAGTKLLIRVLLSVPPPRVTFPDTAITSYCVPAVVPPISASMVPLLSRLPVMDKVPATPVPPGFRFPWLVNVLPAPTSMVPEPEIVPIAALVKPPDFWNVAPDATWIRPFWLNVPLL